VSELEQIVRPVGAGDIRPLPAQGFQSPPPVPGGNLITWGSSGSSMFQLSAHMSQTLPLATWPKSDEVMRKYDVVKIMNKDDSSQFVQVEAMTQYQARNKEDGSMVTYNFAKMNPTEGTIEIISSGNVRKG
jgi:hypothetical protein